VAILEDLPTEKACLPIVYMQAGVVFVIEQLTKNEHNKSSDMQILPLSCTENWQKQLWLPTPLSDDV